ncbi:Kazal-type serine protease inhibitor family protein [Ulvibacter litoralis]|uniref:Kazal-type serine protease inhibitor domain-containing protein n=1 Tax=Ulvibacter litoralis TaxID=227084 RepID=A0A1G7HHH4_9FLAO|nr:Kazal-type serine protease inhibitor [Ulvibacter litoralis]GHC57785.1 hypothetical protein GCM10008083_23010 [Ulvibacter litoralis]SDE99776.1 Kazal-type serine protease inhibitor domain-containing protein [Ulvibacter litoralis]
MKLKNTFTILFFSLLVSILLISFSGCGNSPKSQEPKNETTPQPTTSEVPEGYTKGETPVPIAFEDLSEDCYEVNKKADKTLCADVYDPVCGCDNRNYSNACQAEKAGIKKWTKGNCK